MAEIIANAWTNLRVATRIIGNDGRMITAQAVCHDLETNVAVCKEVKRSIVTKKGYTFSQDMQVVTEKRRTDGYPKGCHKAHHQ